MSEQLSEDSSQRKFDRKEDNQRLGKIASRHFAAAMAALTLWGAGDLWAMSGDMMLAEFVAVANALIAGIILAFLFHEWGHFSGARLSGSFSPVLKEPVSFFMFNFKFGRNSTRQFVAMSLGGPLGNWFLVLLLLFLIPIDNPSRAMLLASTIGVALNVSIFELPIIKRTLAGGEPQKELSSQLESKMPAIGRNTGIVVGALIWAGYLTIG